MPQIPCLRVVPVSVSRWVCQRIERQGIFEIEIPYPEVKLQRLKKLFFPFSLQGMEGKVPYHAVGVAGWDGYAPERYRTTKKSASADGLDNEGSLRPQPLL